MPRRNVIKKLITQIRGQMPSILAHVFYEAVVYI